MKSNRIYLIITCMILIAWLFPIIWFFSQSFRVEREIFSVPPLLIPKIFTLENYRSLFYDFGFAVPYLNSIIVATGTVLLTLLLSIFAGYGFSRYPFRFSNWILLGVIACRMIVPSALLIPLYRIMKLFQLVDTPIALIIAQMTLALPLAIWLLKTFFDELPKELEESAMVDGMSIWQIIGKVVIPLSIPGVAVVAIFTFILSWMDFMFATSFAISFRVGSTAIAGMISAYEILWGEIAAGGLIFSIPVIAIALFLQKYIIRGLTAGAFK